VFNRTLFCVLVILTLLNNGSHVRPNELKFHKFHHHRKKIDPTTLAQYDIVLTTYATAAVDFWRGQSTLHRINWYRVILDEGSFVYSHINSSGLLTAGDSTCNKK
jgi:SWI/SNF-related matrix-associated actin-dependent regulator of chromatin subfamily A3